MPQIVLHFEQEAGPDATVRHLRLEDGRSRHALFFKFLNQSLPDPRVLDGFVAGVLAFAMGSAKDLRVRGPLTRQLLRNLQEYQAAWHAWRPDRYTVIDVVPDSIVDDATGRTERGALSAFSGGIDSTFTAWRHSIKQQREDSYHLRDVLLVHGFDVGLNNASDFQSLIRRCEPLLDVLGLRLRLVSTNLKETKLQDWEDSFAAQLACCLHQYSHEYKYALLGSGEPYGAMVLPWGSNSVTDPLLSGGDMALIHDGAGFTRTQKLQALLDAGLPLQGLRVCWEGKRQDRNCGRCEKCIRTHLSFLATGAAGAPCFDNPLRLEDVKSVLIGNQVQFNQLRSVHDHGAARGLANEPWAVVLRERLNNYRPPGAAGVLLHAVRRKARSLLSGR